MLDSLDFKQHIVILRVENTRTLMHTHRLLARVSFFGVCERVCVSSSSQFIVLFVNRRRYIVCSSLFMLLLYVCIFSVLFFFVVFSLCQYSCRFTWHFVFIHFCSINGRARLSYFIIMARQRTHEFLFLSLAHFHIHSFIHIQAHLLTHSISIS